jgi:hypothetical protein
MSVELSIPQQEALDQQPSEPLRVIDPRTRAAYVVLPVEEYDRLKQRVAEESEDQALQQAWLASATKARRQWVEENPY